MMFRCLRENSRSASPRGRTASDVVAERLKQRCRAGHAARHSWYRDTLPDRRSSTPSAAGQGRRHALRERAGQRRRVVGSRQHGLADQSSTTAASRHECARAPPRSCCLPSLPVGPAPWLNRARVGLSPTSRTRSPGADGAAAVLACRHGTMPDATEAGRPARRAAGRGPIPQGCAPGGSSRSR